MSSKIPNQSVSLDDLSASELNAAIDDTNFPGNTKCPNSNANNNAPKSVSNGKPLSAAETDAVTSTEKRSSAPPVVGGQQQLQQQPQQTSSNGSSVGSAVAAAAASAGPPAAKRRPNLALKFGPPLVDSDGLETPGTAPWTPRTSTTPGICL